MGLPMAAAKRKPSGAAAKLRPYEICVNPGTVILAGSAIGRIARQNPIASPTVSQNGDAIILLASSGVHTNGLALCRRIAQNLPQGYLTKIEDGRSFGEALLDASLIYVNFITAAQRINLPLHYAVHLTGHGWRKLMRAAGRFIYRLTDLRPPPPIFDFLMRAGPIDLREMYGTFNMGIGFAAYVAADDAQRCVGCAQEAGYDAWIGGTVVKNGDRKAVEIIPLGLSYEADTLKLR